MTKLTIEIPDALHQAIKSFAYSHGLTIRDFFIEAAFERLGKMSGLELKNKKSSDMLNTKKAVNKIVKSRLIKLVKNAKSTDQKTKNKRGK